MDGLARYAMKDVASCDKSRRGACSLWTGNLRMRLRNKLVRVANAGNWNVLVPAGKETKWDAVSKGDWTQQRANWIPYRNVWEMWCGHRWFFVSESELYWKVRPKRVIVPYEEAKKNLMCPRVVLIGYWAWMWETATSNPKYKSRPIEYSTVRERWKVLLTES